jgi:hypothetical protein
MVVRGMDASAFVPEPHPTSDWHLRCSAVFG